MRSKLFSHANLFLIMKISRGKQHFHVIRKIKFCLEGISRQNLKPRLFDLFTQAQFTSLKHETKHDLT